VALPPIKRKHFERIYIMAVEQVGKNAPDGMNIGYAATNKVSFFGATPVVQQTNAALVTVSTITTASQTTTPYGFATSTQADNLTATVKSLVTAVNLIQVALANLGLAA
jgi:hypothetical protein